MVFYRAMPPSWHFVYYAKDREGRYTYWPVPTLILPVEVKVKCSKVVDGVGTTAHSFRAGLVPSSAARAEARVAAKAAETTASTRCMVVGVCCKPKKITCKNKNNFWKI